MNYTKHDIGYLEQGALVVVALRCAAANVRLLDDNNLSHYQAGRPHTFCGGLMTHSPVRIPVPSNGNWHIVVDMLGLKGAAEPSVSVISVTAKHPEAT